MSNRTPDNGWREYQRLVLDRLERLDDRIDSLDRKADANFAAMNLRIQSLRDEEIGTLKVEVAMLKVKSGLWGAAAGLIPALAVALYVIVQ